MKAAKIFDLDRPRGPQLAEVVSELLHRPPCDGSIDDMDDRDWRDFLNLMRTDPENLFRYVKRYVQPHVTRLCETILKTGNRKLPGAFVCFKGHKPTSWQRYTSMYMLMAKVERSLREDERGILNPEYVHGVVELLVDETCIRSAVRSVITALDFKNNEDAYHTYMKEEAMYILKALLKSHRIRFEVEGEKYALLNRRVRWSENRKRYCLEEADGSRRYMDYKDLKSHLVWLHRSHRKYAKRDSERVLKKSDEKKSSLKRRN